MRSPFFRFTINLALLLSALIMIYSGLLLQVEYHLGNHGNIVTENTVFGISYYGWSSIHKVSIVILSMLMIYHLYLHRKWYSSVFKKRLVLRNKQVLMLSVLFVFVALTGYIPWIIYLQGVNIIYRKAFIEIHDKLAIILTIYIILHIIKRLRWFLTTFEKIKTDTTHTKRIS
ncbi:MAG: DUF4405 domain-containing protein [Bacteroidales bacterium]|nr:DUF4405 domain-containing protein [Bacteroidales bacterium]